MTVRQGFVARESQLKRETLEITRVSAAGTASSSDAVSVEEPLEIRLSAPGIDEFTLTITMRTPGHDDELALGFLYTEGVIESLGDVAVVEHCRPSSGDLGIHNSLRVVLEADVAFDMSQLARHFYTASSCGVCGKTSIESVMQRRDTKIPDSLRLTFEQIQQLPIQLREQQTEFSATGGIHAVGLIDGAGKVVRVREDVGRHNAMDKLVGSLLLESSLPLAEHGVVLSGRASFEMVQKAAAVTAQVIIAIGPPSSLAIALAKETGITLAGFLRDARFNLYSHESRLD
jgi:FdhD protein